MLFLSFILTFAILYLLPPHMFVLSIMSSYLRYKFIVFISLFFGLIVSLSYYISFFRFKPFDYIHIYVDFGLRVNKQFLSAPTCYLQFPVMVLLSPMIEFLGFIHFNLVISFSISTRSNKLFSSLLLNPLLYLDTYCHLNVA